MAQQTTCATTLWLDSIDMDPITGFDMSRATAVFDELEALVSKCDTAITAFGGSPQGFSSISVGTVNPGGNCNPDANATSKLAAIDAALASCKGPGTNACLAAPAGMDWKCTPRADSGGRCFTDRNCKDGLFCDNPQFALYGATCAARKDVGADCMLDNECKSLLCSDAKCSDVTKEAAYCLNTSK